jgi:hypothetical protein
MAPIALLLLHEGGWDEVLMVAAGLVIAYAVIVWTGRRNKELDEDEWYDDDEPSDQAPEQPGNPASDRQQGPRS